MSVSSLPRYIKHPNCFQSRIDILNDDESIESVSLELLHKLKTGALGIEDLMGPLCGIPNLTPDINIPPGRKEKTDSASEAPFYPQDEYNTLLEHHVHPHDYVNPIYDDEYDLVVIGAGVAGLLSVIIGAWLGKSCALIERHSMGGDCLNIGCVPSKALIACARAFHSLKTLDEFGITLPEGNATIDFGKVMRRMREIRAKISHHDSVQRYSKEFCKHVYVGEGIFTGGKVVEVTGSDGSKRVLRFKKAMIATGASASIPPIPGLRTTTHLTNANFFNLVELPPRMLVIGCGPIGLEISQCMARFGCFVTCLEVGDRILPREDPDASTLVAKQLLEDGVNLLLNIKIISIERVQEGELYQAPWGLYSITIETKEGVREVYQAEALLNATGRTPNVTNIGLENVGVEWDNRCGVHVDDYFRTANPDIYSCGDCTSPYKFTHSADFQARAAIRNMFLGDQCKQSDLLIPWCTYTEPEVAHVGKYEAELKASGTPFETFVRPLEAVDRCICDGIKSGFVKITLLAGTGQIIGATICGPNAGDMISQLTVCMQYGISIAQLAGVIHPYPTTQEAVRQCALQFNKYFKDPQALPLTTLRLLMKEKEEQEQEQREKEG